MLVIARRPNEALRIGSEIRIIINSAERNRVLVGIEAPIHIPVDREEIYLRKRQEQLNASDAPTDAAQPQNVADLLPIGTLGRLAHRFRVRADSYMADARQRPSDREAVIRLTAMASTLNWAASEIEALEGKFRARHPSQLTKLS
ncbi:MAG: carbon storage regulator [Gammaproteobacteria bacterium]